MGHQASERSVGAVSAHPRARERPAAADEARDPHVGSRRHLAQAERQIQPSQVVSYYDKHKAAFVLPEQRDIAWIVINSESLLQCAVRENRGVGIVRVARHVARGPRTITGIELSLLGPKHPRYSVDMNTGPAQHSCCRRCASQPACGG
jgi:hypothetical protein